MKEGVIADFEVTEAMMCYFITRAHNRQTLVKPRIIICSPGTTDATATGTGGTGGRPRVGLVRRDW